MKQFDHERLDVYQAAIQFVEWTGGLFDGPLRGCGLSAAGQLDRAGTSIPLNIAEGNGKRSMKDRCRYLDAARGSAMESAAALDVLVARKKLIGIRIEPGMEMLIRVVEMLTKMIERLMERA